MTSRVFTAGFPQVASISLARMLRKSYCRLRGHQFPLTVQCALGVANDHPDRHRDHDQVLGERNEAERHPAVAADTGTLDLALVDIDRLENRNRTDGADEECDGYGYPIERAGNHQHAG